MSLCFLKTLVTGRPEVVGRSKRMNTDKGEQTSVPRVRFSYNILKLANLYINVLKTVIHLFESEYFLMSSLLLTILRGIMKRCRLTIRGGWSIKTN